MLTPQTSSQVLHRAPSGDPSRVLVVDDEPLVRRWMERVLVDAGYVVDVAGDGAAAVAMLETQRYELILTDVTMPKLDGLGVLIASITRDATVPVVMMTGAPRPDFAERALSIGAAQLMLKPMPLENIVESIGRWVRLHRMQTIAHELRGLLPHLLAPNESVPVDLDMDAMLAQLQLAYQPIVRARDQHVIGNEALLRSRHPGFNGARAVLEAATRLGRRKEVGARVRQQCQIDRGRDDRLLFINGHTDELDDLLHADHGFGQKAPRVVVELQQPHVTLAQQAQIAELRRQGYRVCLMVSELRAVGPSSLVPDIVKLDMDLVRGIDESDARQQLCGTLIAACAELSIAVIALGVETVDELRALSDVGCELFQGHALGSPEL